MYTYKFAMVLPEDYEADATHTLISAPRRSFSTYPDLIAQGVESSYYDPDLYNFVPSGASEPQPRDIVADASCNRCHQGFKNTAHGERYGSVQACQNCHNPTYMGARNAPERVLNAMIHQVHSSGGEFEVPYPAPLYDCEVCHTGGTPTADRPLAANPSPIKVCDGSGRGQTTMVWAAAASSTELRIKAADGQLFTRGGASGSRETGKWVFDGMDFFLLDMDSGDLLQRQNVNLTVNGCAGNAPFDYGHYVATPAAQHSKWMTNPTRAACGGCHEYENEEYGLEPIDWVTGENHLGGAWDTDEYCSFCHQADSGNEFDRSVRGAHVFATNSYSNSAQLDGVYVEIKSVTNTGPGQSPTVTFAVNSKNGPINPASLDRLLLKLSGPNTDFSYYVSEDARSNLVASGSDWSYTFAATLPADAAGSYSVSFEGRALKSITTHAGTVSVRDAAENYTFPFAVTDSTPTARVQVVDDAKCESCHSSLSLHGGNRHNGGQYCQVCHRADATTGDGPGDEGIHFKYMVHKIHRGAELENGFQIGNFDASEIEYPGDLRNCDACHVDDSYELPLPAGRLPTESPNTFLTEMQPITAACLSCHDGYSAAAHADANTSVIGESCEICHAEGKTYAVSRMHAQ